MPNELASGPATTVPTGGQGEAAEASKTVANGALTARRSCGALPREVTILAGEVTRMVESSAEWSHGAPGGPGRVTGS